MFNLHFPGCKGQFQINLPAHKVIFAAILSGLVVMRKVSEKKVKM